MRVKVLFCFVLLPLALLASDRTADLLDSRGDSRRIGMWYVVQEKRSDLLKPVAEILLTSEDVRDQKQVLNVFAAYGDDLETALPEWYVYVDHFLKSGRDEDLLIQAMDLGVKWKEYRLMNAFARMAVHPMHRVRLHAFRSMAALRNDQIMPILLGLSNSGRAIERMYALEGMQEYSDSRVAPFAEKLLQDPNRSVRIFAIPGYAAQPGSDGNSYAIARLFTQEGDEEVRERVIDLIATRKWGQHTTLVAQACSDPSSLVRAAAFRGARVFNLAGSVSRQLEQEPEARLRSAGLDALAAIGNSGGGTGLAHILSSDENPALRLKAAALLGMYRERMGLSSLHYNLRNDSSADVRAEAADALGDIGDPSSAQVLRTVMEDDQEQIAVKSAAMLSFLKLPLADKKSVLLSIVDTIKDRAFARQLQRAALSFNGR
ncbi:MAG TPA: HEAT repeat domain-containing protein [Leptospiraceae bacterium]|nr:HEAT repeat domain-containing protein [Leptospirales bacterium]HMW58156.1 HEAT repeat domain-containing protein [Leptospiraceae bacterium]HMX57283.1 HEAT repeat domain-containing protein [Leptospiraceae bacterium]HMY45585.1 HEAT repeat domain-containing protein [Leptospiraceae bacterium]HNE23253.1 HEAT repeat domain-containing protein [Leptospiraceae bacterium]